MNRYLIVLVVAVGLLGACGSDEADPAAAIEAYGEAFNAGDLDAVMALFSEASVVVDHWRAADSPFRAASPLLAGEALGPFFIESLGGADLVEAVPPDAEAVPENALRISNVEVSGNTVTWDEVYTSGVGFRICSDGVTAVIEDGTIMTWTYPDDVRWFC